MIQSADDCWPCRSVRLSVLAFAIFIAEAGDSNAQVVLDGKFGTAGAVAGPNYSITSDMGAVRGNNLFHSFTQFDLNYGDVAAFSGPASIQNILTRVTGSASSINGTIRSEIAGANFFFINPQGIVFGPNAKVDVSGSFAFSTADYLKLSDGARFVASLDAEDSVLSTAPVSAFGFIKDTPGSIVLQQTVLEGKENSSVSLIAGDITLQGASVLAPAGEINVASVKSSGEIAADLSTTTRSDFLAAFPQQGQINLQAGAKLDASGEGGGRIVIRGGNLLVDNSRIEANSLGAGIGRGIDIALAQDLDLRVGQINSLSPAGLGASGNIVIEGEDIRLNGDGLFDDFFNPATQISTTTGDLFAGGGPAQGGDIIIRAGTLDLVNSAQIASATYGAGNAGSIDIHASNVRLDALQFTMAQISANTQQIDGAGSAGDIRIKTDHLEMLNGATILAASFGSGEAGVIDINAQSVDILSGAVIVAGASGSAAGGNIQIDTRSLRIDGTDLLFGGPDLLTGIQAVTASPDFAAPGGQIEINAHLMELDHSATLFTSSFGAGRGGNIEIAAGNLTINHASTISATGEANGAAGSINIRSGQNVTLHNMSAIRTSAPSSSGGNIAVAAGSEIRLIDSEINAQAGLDGGNITIAAADLIYLRNSSLTGQADSTGSGFGNGGNLTIEPSRFLILNDSALISKSSLGNGGNISIFSDLFFQSDSIIDATAPFGLPGTVSVTAPEVDLSGSLVALSGSLLDLDSELRPDCAIRLSGDISTFILLGRGGLPIQPGGFLPSGILPLDEAR
jgi:filamentous hemagglutinin family protein